MILLLVTAMHVSANSVAQKMSLSVNKLPLQKVFSLLKKQTGYYFFYTANDLRQTTPVSVKLQEASIEEVLKEVFRDQPVTFTIEGKTVVVNKKPALHAAMPEWLPAPPSDIRGIIVNENGEPLAGALVKLKGATAKGTVTNEKGEFMLPNIDAATAEIEIHFIGYENKLVTLGGKTDWKIVLKASIHNLESAGVQVVSTGYQTLSRERSTGSFSNPDMKVVQARSSSMDLLQRLDGLIPGLTLNNAPMASGPAAGPAGTANKAMFPVLLRGLTSVNSNTQPLYVVDGIPLDDFSSINPNDVQDISVLKDATAASIWGARAANGVIVVTTKKGTPGQPLKVDYDHFVSFQGKPDIDVFPVMNSAEYINAMKEVFNLPDYTTYNPYNMAMVPSQSRKDYEAAVYPHEFLLYNQVGGTPLTWMPAYYQNKTLDALATIDNTGQMKDLFYRNAFLSNQTLSLSGSSGKYNVYASVSYVNQQNPYPGNGNHTYKLNARQDYNFNKAFKVYLITDLTNNYITSARNIYPDNRFLPYASFTNPDGAPLDMSWLLTNDSIRTNAEAKSIGLADLGQLNLAYSPLSDINTGTVKTNLFNNRITAGFALKLIKGLQLEGVYGAVLGNTQQESYDDITSYRMQARLGKFVIPPGGNPPYPDAPPVTQVTAYLPTTGGKQSTTNIQQKRWTIRHQLVYDNQWNNGRHQLTVLGGIETQQQSVSYINTAVFGYDRNLLTHKPVDAVSLSGRGLMGSILGSVSSGSYFNSSELFNTSYTDTRFQSYYGNAAYTFSRRYTLNLSSRYDKSNMFGTDKSAQSRPVWSVGTAWLLSRESFMENVELFNRLSLRATYGITGNAPQPPGAANKDILSPGTTTGSLPAGAVTPLTINSPANKTLTWEQTQNFNMGLDFAILKSRLSGSIEYYHKHTTNLISRVPLNSFAGFSYIKGNLGTINNDGIEIRLNSTNVVTRNFSWTTNFNFAWNKGKIVELNTNAFPVAYADQLMTGFMRWTDNIGSYENLSGIGLVSGYAPFTLFAYRYAGLTNTGDAKIRLADGSETKSATAIGINDVRNMGTYTPVYAGGLTNTFSWKQFSLSVNLVYNLGHVMRRDVNDFYTGKTGFGAESLPDINNDGGLYSGISAFNRGNLYRDFANRWKKPGDEAFTNIPAYHVNGNDLNNSFPSFYTLGDVNVVSASYIKARDITLQYGLPQHWYRKIGITNINLRVQMNNLMVWKANKDGIDPEFQNAVGFMGNTYTSTGKYVQVGSRTAPFNQHSFTVGLHVSL